MTASTTMAKHGRSAAILSQVSCEKCDTRAASIFCSLNKTETALLSGNSQTHIYRKGDIIFSEGGRPGGIYCILSGKVKLYKRGNEGKEQIVRLAKDSDFIGYRSLLSGDTYSATATAIEESSICFIPQSVFFHLINNSNDLSLKFIRLMCDKLREAEMKIARVAQKSLRFRLAESLLMLKDFFGIESGGERSGTINVSLTREELANLVGTAPGCIMRLLAEFKEQKLIDLQGKKIKITNLESLQQVAKPAT